MRLSLPEASARVAGQSVRNELAPSAATNWRRLMLMSGSPLEGGAGKQQGHAIARRLGASECGNCFGIERVAEHIACQTQGIQPLLRYALCQGLRCLHSLPQRVRSG